MQKKLLEANMLRSEFACLVSFLIDGKRMCLPQPYLNS